MKVKRNTAFKNIVESTVFAFELTALTLQKGKVLEKLWIF